MPKAKPSQNLTLIGQITSISDEIGKAARTLAELDLHVKNLETLQKKILQTVEDRSTKVAALLDKAEQSQTASLAKLRALEKATNSKLLKIQTRMQDENRLFTSVSNVLKTRHDTVKNSIGNIR